MDSILDSRGKNHLNETLISTHLEALRTVVYATAALQQICEREKDKLQGTGLDTFVEAWFTELPPEQVKDRLNWWKIWMDLRERARSPCGDTWQKVCF